MREVARFAAVPAAALVHLFPSRAAAYVRLGTLAERGFLSRTTAFGRQAYQLTPKGAAVAGRSASRATTGSGARAARLAAVAALLAPLGYGPVPAPRPGMPKAVAWFACGKRLVAVYASAARLTGQRVRRLLGRLRIYRHTVHAIVLAGNGETKTQVVRNVRFPPVAVIPIPPRAAGREVLTSVLHAYALRLK
jgi:hypothetical protein